MGSYQDCYLIITYIYIKIIIIYYLSYNNLYICRLLSYNDFLIIILVIIAIGPYQENLTFFIFIFGESN